MTVRAREVLVLAGALALSDDERRDLVEQLVSSLPADPEWLAELERRARRAVTDPDDGEAWEVVEQRLESRIARRRRRSRGVQKLDSRTHMLRMKG